MGMEKLCCTYMTWLCRGQVLLVQRRGVCEADTCRAQPSLHPSPNGICFFVEIEAFIDTSLYILII
jgi:hypothetical protein